MRQDYAKSFKWYEKAANQEPSADKASALAQYSLGLMYYEGKGVRQNVNIAKSWFGESCDNGYQDSCDNYRGLNSK